MPEVPAVGGMRQRILLASYFTIAGDVHPLKRDVPSPFDFRARVEAAGRAGFRGFGMFHTDLVPVLARHGHAGMRSIFADNGIDWIEVECLFDWFADGERRRASDANRRLLLDAAAGLGAFHVKVATDINALDAAGFDGPFGIEVLSAEVRAMPLEDVVRRAFATTARAFDATALPLRAASPSRSG